MASRSVMIVVSAQLVKLLLSLLLQIIIARLLLPDGRGVYGICIAISTVLMVVTYCGNEFGIRYLLLRKRITSAQALRYLLLTAGVALTLALILSGIGAATGILPVDRISLLQIGLACVFSFSQLVSTQINVFLTLRAQYFEASVIAVFEELGKLCLAAILLYQLQTVEIALASSIVTSAMVATYSLFKFDLYKKDYSSIRRRDIAFIYKYGIRSMWLNLGGLSNAHMGTLVLSGLMSNSQVGLYNLAFGLIGRLQVLPDALNRVLVPASMRNRDGTRRLNMVGISVTGLLAVSLFILPFLAMFNTQIMVILFGSEYAGSGPIAVILFVGFMFRVIGKPIEAHFNEIIGKPHVLAGIQIFSITTMALFTYVGAIRFGLFGAALGSAAAIIFSSIILFVAYSRSTGQPLSSLFRPRLFFATIRNTDTAASFRPIIAR